MSDDAKKWSWVVARLQRALGFALPTIGEAEADMAEAEEVPMSDGEIRRIVEAATATDAPTPVDPEPDYEWTSEFTSEGVEEDMLVLNREAGEEDPEVTQRIEQLRKEALSDDEKEHDETRLADE